MPIPKMEREMSGRTIDDFLDDADAFNALSDEDKARLVAGETLEGETNTDPVDPVVPVEENGEPPAAVVVDPAKSDPPVVVEPVVLAKDGQHTIPFSELESARERARQLELQVQELQAAKVEKPQADPPATAEPSFDEALASLVKERDEALFSGDTETAHQLSMKIIGVQQEQATRAALAVMESREAQKQEKDDRESAMADANARAAVLVEKYPFLNPQGPATNQDAIDLVVAQRDRLMQQGVSFADAVEQAVAKVAPLFADKGSPTKQPEAVDVAAKAAEAISKAKAAVPTSLSQVPAGASVHHDEGEAIRSDSGLSLINRFLGKSPEEIEKIVNRVI
jgi:hypothetical protein